MKKKDMFSSFFRQAEIPLKIMSLASRKTCVTNDKNERELKLKASHNGAKIFMKSHLHIIYYSESV